MEQIGYVYEGLLSFEGFRAAETVVGLTGKDGREEEVALATLESTAAAHVSAETLAARLAELYKDSGIGSPRALTTKLAPLTGDERAQAETRLYAVTRDHALVQRLLPFYRIIRQDLRSDPVVDGIGFTMEPARAHELIERDPRNTDVLLPYLNGHDLNSHPNSSASRWVINSATGTSR